MNGPLFVLPAHNESDCLERVVAELTAAVEDAHPKAQILVVDDGSTDYTQALLPVLAARFGVQWLRLPERLGVGTATLAGIRHARHHGLAPVVRIDADGQHDPADIDTLLETLREHSADAVSGSRFLGESMPPEAGSIWRRESQRLLGFVLSRLTGRRITDPTSGFWVFGARTLRLLSQDHPSGYPEPELHLLLYRNGLEVVEAEVQMRPRVGGRSTLDLRATMAFAARVMLATVIVPLRSRARARGGRRTARQEAGARLRCQDSFHGEPAFASSTEIARQTVPSQATPL